MNWSMYKWADKLPDENLEVYEPHLKLFFEKMYERQMIWKKRFLDKLPAPWTDDPILRNSKFTNVYRELDRSSQFLISTIILDDGLDDLNLIWKMMVYRLFNNPETFTFHPKNIKRDLFNQDIDFIPSYRWKNGIPDYDEYDELEFERFINGVRASGQNPFTNAYLINSACAPHEKRDYVYTRIALPALHDKISEIYDVITNCSTAEELIEELNTIPTVASFISHELYQDLTYIPRYTKRTFMRFDQNDYTNVGPGASIGIRLIYPSLNTIKEQKQAIYWLRDLAKKELKEIADRRGENFPYLYWNKVYSEYYTTGVCNITLHQIEMWLCEFQKYWKMQIGEGKQRSKFTPKTKVLSL